MTALAPFREKGCLTTGCASCGICFNQPDITKKEIPMAKKPYVQPQQVTTDALATLGTIIDEKQGRDAIHLAVENVEAYTQLYPGQKIGFVSPGVVSSAAPKLIGIVDPFLDGPVYPGQRFWLVVFPRQITSLRHVWEHPDFPAGVDHEGNAILVEEFEKMMTENETLKARLDDINREKIIEEISTSEEEKSKQWIIDYASSIPLRYEDLMQGAADMVAAKGGWGGYLCFGGLLEGMSVPEEFWDHYENVTGQTVAYEHRQSFFTCSC